MISKKQISPIVILCFIFACAQNIDAMRCGIKPLKLAYKTRQITIAHFPNGDPNSPLKRLQRIYDSLENVEPNCFATVEKTNACKYQESCCLLAKNSVKLAKKGKAIRLKEISADNDAVHIDILKDIVKSLSILQQKNVEAHAISASRYEADIEPLRQEFCELIKNISECLVYSANIHGTTFQDCCERYYKKNPQGIFATKHMTPQEHEREKLQDECNEINKELMKNNGYPLNQNILLSWRDHSMDRAYVEAWLDAIEGAMRGHDQYYRKDGGNVY